MVSYTSEEGEKWSNISTGTRAPIQSIFGHGDHAHFRSLKVTWDTMTVPKIDHLLFQNK